MEIDKPSIANCGGHENVGLTAALDEVPDDVLSITHHVLGWGGLMIDIEGVDVRAVLEQVFGRGDAGGKMKRRLAIAPARFDKSGVGGHKFAQSVEHAQSGGGMDINNCATLDRVSSQFRTRAVKQPETAGPPATFRVNIRARFH